MKKIIGPFRHKVAGVTYDNLYSVEPSDDMIRHIQPQITNTDPAVPEAAVKRLTGQNYLVLERLRKGPATNMELEKYSGSKRINSRVADVRRWLRAVEDKDIKATAVDAATGLYRYEIRNSTKLFS